MDDLDGTNLVSFGAAGTTGFRTVTIDRDNGFVYYADESNLYRCDLDGNSNVGLDVSSITNIRGIDYNNGLLYIAYDENFAVYDPDQGNGIVIDSVAITGTGILAADIIMINNSVYGACAGDTNGNEKIIIEYSLDGYNQLVQGNTYSTNLYGPHRFITDFSDMIYFCDHSVVVGVTGARLVRMDDISGSNRINYGSVGTGIGQFNFSFSR